MEVMRELAVPVRNVDPVTVEAFEDVELALNVGIGERTRPPFLVERPPIVAAPDGGLTASRLLATPKLELVRLEGSMLAVVVAGSLMDVVSGFSSLLTVRLCVASEDGAPFETGMEDDATAGTVGLEVDFPKPQTFFTMVLAEFMNPKRELVFLIFSGSA